MKLTKRLAAIAACAVMAASSMVGTAASAAVYDSEHQVSETSIDSLNVSGLGQSVDAWANNLLSQSTYGQALSSSNWYNNVSDVKLLARIIYAENTFNTVDQTGVAWVIINRKNYSSFPDTFRDIVTEYDSRTGYQFQSMLSSNAYGSHNKSEMSAEDYAGWRHATWLACALFSTSSSSDYMWLFGKPAGIDKQLFFYASTGASFGTRDGYITVNGNRSKYVAYAGIGEVSSSAEAKKYADSSRNIFYSYYNN